MGYEDSERTIECERRLAGQQITQLADSIYHNWLQSWVQCCKGYTATTREKRTHGAERNLLPEYSMNPLFLRSSKKIMFKAYS